MKTSKVTVYNGGAVIVIGFSCTPKRLETLHREASALGATAENEVTRSPELTAAIRRIPRVWSETIDYSIERGVSVELIGEAGPGDLEAELRSELTQGTDIWVEESGEVRKPITSQITDYFPNRRRLRSARRKRRLLKSMRV